MNITELDAKLNPLLVQLNKARQARDTLPLAFWNAVPYGVRGPINLAFEIVEALEHWLAEQNSQEALRTPAEGHDNSQNAEKGDDTQSQ